MKKPSRGRPKRKPPSKKQPAFTSSTPEKRRWRNVFWETSTFAYAPRCALVRYQTTTQKLQNITREVLYWQEGEWGEARHLLDTVPLHLRHYSMLRELQIITLEVLYWQEGEWEKAMHLFDTLPLHLRHYETMQKLQNIAREVLSEFEHAYPPAGSKEPARPAPSEMRTQLQELEKTTALHLRCLQGLHDPTRYAVELATATLPEPLRLDIDELVKKLRFLLSTVRRVLLTHKPSTGRPQNEVMRRWVWRLCDWWVRSTGKTPESWHDRITAEYNGEFHQFAFSALSPALGDRGLNAVIEKVVKRWRESTSENR